MTIDQIRHRTQIDRAKLNSQCVSQIVEASRAFYLSCTVRLKLVARTLQTTIPYNIAWMNNFQ